jgi:hypothetical protein
MSTGHTVSSSDAKRHPPTHDSSAHQLLAVHVGRFLVDNENVIAMYLLQSVQV